MEKNKSDLFIICGEKSGDIHGADIIRSLLQKSSNLRIHCWGGSKMKKACGKILEDYSSYNIMGFVEVILNIGLIYSKLNKCKRDIKKLNPKRILLIDFPASFSIKISVSIKLNLISFASLLPIIDFPEPIMPHNVTLI